MINIEREQDRNPHLSKDRIWPCLRGIIWVMLATEHGYILKIEWTRPISSVSGIIPWPGILEWNNGSVKWVLTITTLWFLLWMKFDKLPQIQAAMVLQHKLWAKLNPFFYNHFLTKMLSHQWKVTGVVLFNSDYFNCMPPSSPVEAYYYSWMSHLSLACF